MENNLLLILGRVKKNNERYFMSSWANIAGVIRFDALDREKQHPKKFLGNTCCFDDEQSVWDKCDVPRGSEGSLQYEIYENPIESSLAAYHVLFYGDLRDKGEEILEEMQKYLDRISIGRSVRQGIFEINISRKQTRIFEYRAKKWCTSIALSEYEA